MICSRVCPFHIVCSALMPLKQKGWGAQKSLVHSKPLCHTVINNPVKRKCALRHSASAISVRCLSLLQADLKNLLKWIKSAEVLRRNQMLTLSARLADLCKLLGKKPQKNGQDKSREKKPSGGAAELSVGPP